MSPAITDADLARLLGAGDGVPALPAGLADRIMAALPAATTQATLVPPLPPITAPRRRTLHGQSGRWLRGGVAVVAGLGLATAVAAGLARTPLFAPLLTPVIERLAEVTGLPALAPPRRPAPVAATPAAPPAPVRTAPPPVRIESALPALPAPLPTILPAPPQIEAPRPALPDRLQPADRPARERRAASPRVPVARPITEGPMAARAVLQRPLPEAAGLERPGIERAGIERPGMERPALERTLTERPLADLVPPERPLRERSGAEAPSLPEAGADRLSARASDPAAANGPEPTEPAGAATDAARPEAAAVTAEIKALREARSAGTLTAAQAQRLRSLQQLRAARATRNALPRTRR